jgi:basic membrane lipoprotein Med (substrate-binding protein (PBP1-ABC) superfamily)
MRIALFIVATISLISCGNKQVSTAPQEKSDECIFKDEVCKDAIEFQNQYELMDEEKRESMTTVLNSYIEHCEAARKACKKSMH